MKPGDVCLALFPLGGAGGRKLRPVLVLTPPIGSVPEYVVAYVSSATPPDPLPSDLWLDPADPATASSGVTKRSVVRLHKIATLHQRTSSACSGRSTMRCFRRCATPSAAPSRYERTETASRHPAGPRRARSPT